MLGPDPAILPLQLKLIWMWALESVHNISSFGTRRSSQEIPAPLRFHHSHAIQAHRRHRWLRWLGAKFNEPDGEPTDLRHQQEADGRPSHVGFV